MRLNDVEMDLNTAELHVVRHPPKAQHGIARYCVIAVHGLGGSRDISWTTKDGLGQSVTWIKQLLPDHIEDARILAYDYTQGPEQDTVCLSVNVLYDLAAKLLELLLEGFLEQTRSLVFVGHNYGGLIIKQALLLAVNSLQYSKIAEKTSLAVFFGTPHRAVDMNSWERMACRMIFGTYQRWQGRVSELIDRSSRTLITSSEDFQTTERIFNVLNVFEQRGSSLLGSPPVIGKYAATMEAPNAENIGREQTHLYICKFDSGNDPVFQQICKAIKTSQLPDPDYLKCLRELHEIDCQNYIHGVAAPNVDYKWILSHEAYKIWKKQTSGVLSLQGKSGSGVSALASFVAMKASQPKNDVEVIEYSLDSGDDRHRSTYSMLASLSYQLLCLRPEIFEHVKVFYLEMTQDFDWRHDRLWGLLQALLSCPYHGTTICLLDGVDACVASGGPHLHDLLKLPGSRNSTLKLIVTTNTPLPTAVLPISIDIDQTSVLANRKDEFTSALEEEYKSLLRSRPSFQHIQSEIRSRLQTFLAALLDGSTSILTAKLTLTLLATTPVSSTVESMKQALDALPNDLNEIYHRMFHEQISPGYQRMARKALGWMALAYRPLKLTELSLALTLEPDSTSMSGHDRWIPHDLGRDLDRMFGLFVRIEDGEIRFIHKSFRSFVLDFEPCGKSDCILHWRKSINHAIITQTCLTYLNSLRAKPGERLGPQQLSLRSYVSQYWYAHYKIAILAEVPMDLQKLSVNGKDNEKALELQETADVRLERNSFPPNRRVGPIEENQAAVTDSLHSPASDNSLQYTREDINLVVEDDAVKGELTKALETFAKAGINTWAEFCWDTQTKANLTPFKGTLVTAVSFQCTDLVQILLESSPFEPEVLGHALAVAAMRGDVTLVRLLIKNGAENSLILHLAAIYGHAPLVQKILEDGDDPNILDTYGITPLIYACCFGHIDVVRMLIDRGASIGQPIEDVPVKSGPAGSTCLHQASQSGQTRIIELLLEKSADAGALDENHATPLHEACEWQQPQAVYALLPTLSSVEAATKGLWRPKTVLHVAAASGRVEIVDSLLEAYSQACERNDWQHGPLPNLLLKQDKRGKTPLHIAAEQGHFRVVERLLKEEVNGPGAAAKHDDDGAVPLHLSARQGNASVVELLLKKDHTQTETEDSQSRTPLHYAVLAGSHVDVVRLLCEQHLANTYTLNGWDSDQKTPLHIASKKGDPRIVETLLASGAECNIGDEHDNTPLHTATLVGHTDVVKTLIEHGANLKSKNNNGDTPLHIAGRQGNVKVVKQLLGAPNVEDLIHIRNNSGRSPIMLAAKHGHIRTIKELENAGAKLDEIDNAQYRLLSLAAKYGHNSVVNYALTKRPQDIEAEDLENNRPLHLASAGGHLNIVRDLLKAGADPRAKNSDDKTPIEVADKEEVALEIIKGYEPITAGEMIRIRNRCATAGFAAVLVVLRSHRDLHTRDDEGKTGLSYAAANGHLDIVRVLLEAAEAPSVVGDSKVDPNSRDVEGRTAFSYAAEAGALDILEELLLRLSKLPDDINQADGSKRTPLWYASKLRGSEAVDFLLKHGANPNLPDESGRTALHMAASEGSLGVIRSLLESEKKPDGNAQDRDKATPMYLAAFYGHADVVDYLLNKGLRTNMPGPAGWYPIHAAYDNITILRKLIDAGSDLDAKNDEGCTALFLSVKSNFPVHARLLLDHGADPLAGNQENYTPLHEAASQMETKILELLLHHIDTRTGKLLSYHIDERTGSKKIDMYDGNRLSLSVETAQTAPYNVQDCKGHSPLIVAVRSESEEAVEALISRPQVEIYLKDFDGHTALWHAVGYSAAALLNQAVGKENSETGRIIWSAFGSLGWTTAEANLLHLGIHQSNIELMRVMSAREPQQRWKDEHGWSLVDIIAALDPTDEAPTSESEFRLPSRWDVGDKASALTVGEDGLTVKYDSDAEGQAGAIRADHPIPPNNEFYFEVTVTDQGDNSSDINNGIAVGFGTQNARLDARPGLVDGTWGYHSEDGGIFNYPVDITLYRNGTFGKGDVIGCCIDPRHGTAYFTKNNEKLEEGFEGIKGRLFPMVGLECRGLEVKANFSPGLAPPEEKYDNTDEGLFGESLLGLLPSEVD